MEDAPVVKLINAILTDAVKRGASDIHFECFEHDIRVRYRIDGALQEVMKPPMKLKAALISRFKIMAQLNIAERRVPQDGRIKLKYGKKVIDYRVSTLPTLFGEKIVLRILDKGNLTLDLEKFGIEPQGREGPDGGGAESVRHGARHRPDGLRQDDDALLGALEGQQHRRQHHDGGGSRRVQPLRRQPGAGAHRHRHDVRRGAEGVPAAGPEHHHGRRDPRPGDGRHRHQGGAHGPHGALARCTRTRRRRRSRVCMDMGLEPFNVASALNLVLAQRLAAPHLPELQGAVHADERGARRGEGEARRRRSASSSSRRDAIENAKARATKEAAPLSRTSRSTRPSAELPFFQGEGCDACGGTGLKGRQGVYEVMPMTPKLRKLILQNVGAAEIRDAAVEEGMLTLRMDGWMKVMKGITTLEQVIRETTA